MREMTVQNTGYRSLFWPIVLIAVGVIWLLGNMGVISGANLVVLLRLWPLILILVGLDLLFGRRSPVIGGLIGFGTVAVLIVLMLVGPSVGLGAPEMDVVVEDFSAPRDDVTSARIELDLSLGNTTIQALTDSNDLFAAEVSHVGTMTFVSEGQTEKTITLRQEQTDFDFFEGLGFLSAFVDPQDDLYWNVGLSPAVPIDLHINGGAGASALDLSEIDLSGLDVNVGVGRINLQLPAATTDYEAVVSGGVGEVNVVIADDAALTLNIDGGVGSFTVDVPDGAAVRLRADTGVGSVNVPSEFRETGEDTWETSNYREADQRITIDFNGGVGNLTVR